MPSPSYLLRITSTRKSAYLSIMSSAAFGSS